MGISFDRDFTARTTEELTTPSMNEISDLINHIVKRAFRSFPNRSTETEFGGLTMITQVASVAGGSLKLFWLKASEKRRQHLPATCRVARGSGRAGGLRCGHIVPRSEGRERQHHQGEDRPTARAVVGPSPRRSHVPISGAQPHRHKARAITSGLHPRRWSSSIQRSVGSPRAPVARFGRDGRGNDA